MSASDDSEFVFDVTSETFDTDVMERSREVLVIVDFWAPWCGPCKQLAPLLESAVASQQGAAVLAKVNTETAPDLAETFRVQSIPYVIAVRNGQIVNQMVGVAAPDEIEEWVRQSLPSEAEQLVMEARSLGSASPSRACELLAQAVALEPGSDDLQIEYAEMLVADQQQQAAAEIIARLAGRGYLEPRAEKLQSELALWQAAAAAGSVDEARAAVEAAPDDLTLQLKLIDALAAEGREQEALDLCLKLVERDKSGVGEDARRKMIQIFDVLGPENALVGEYRRKLTMLLY